MEYLQLAIIVMSVMSYGNAQKRRRIKAMKCKTCGRRKKTNSKIKLICWEDYGLCGDCCRKEHPEVYSNNIANMSHFSNPKTKEVKSKKKPNTKKPWKYVHDRCYLNGSFSYMKNNKNLKV